jgi:histone deacetylase complex subunit SAP18
MEVNRAKTCPFLLRCFWKLHRNNSINSYRNAGNGVVPNQEVQIYTWMDATLRELCDILKNVVPGLDDPNTCILFSLIFVDANGNVGMKQVTFLHCRNISKLVV